MLHKATIVSIAMLSMCLLTLTLQAQTPAPAAAAPAATAAPAAAPAAPAATAAPAPAAAPKLEPIAPESPSTPAPGQPAGEKAPVDANRKSGDANTTGQGGNPGLFGGSYTLPLLLVGMVVLMFVFNGRTRKKQEAKRSEMLGGMKKGDRVQTIGGVIGTLIEVRDQEVVVKIDEQNNTRMRFVKSAIAHVGEGQAEKDDKKS